MASREPAGPYQVVGMLLTVCGRRDEPGRKLLLPPKLQPDFSSSRERRERLVRRLVGSGWEWRDGMGTRGNKPGGKCLPMTF